MAELERFGVDESVGTYGTRLRARNDPKHPCNKSFGAPTGVSEATKDRIADEKYQKEVMGGFRLTRQVRVGNKVVRVSNKCDRCFQLKSRNGTCGCIE